MLLALQADCSLTHLFGHQHGLSVSLTPVERVQRSDFVPEWSTVKQWIGKSVDPQVSSLWQQGPGASPPMCLGLNKELG